MGRIFFPTRDFYDGASELVAIKSGILLNRFKIATVLQTEFDDAFLRSDDLDRFIRIRSETMMNMVVHLRQSIGNLPQEWTTQADYKVLHDYLEKTKDLTISGLGTAGAFMIDKHLKITREQLVEQLMAKYKIDHTLGTAAANIAFEIADTSIILPSNTDWNGITPLENLFDGEIKPLEDTTFIEQKFIDYLATNGHEIELIHWRNFERFCAQYFKQQGFHVQLGPGTADGGVDIRVFKDQDDAAPLILIQCKRYKGEKHVTIETVKSFYTDVVYENAESGLIATTGYIAPGGKKVCSVRNYNIGFAEKSDIMQWAHRMKTNLQ